MDAAPRDSRLDSHWHAVRQFTRMRHATETRGKHVKGELLLARNPSNVAEAEQCFPHSDRIPPSAKCEITGVACHDEPRTVAREIGRRDAALAMLAEIYDSFTQDFDARDLNDPKA